MGNKVELGGKEWNWVEKSGTVEIKEVGTISHPSR